LGLSASPYGWRRAQEAPGRFARGCKGDCLKGAAPASWSLLRAHRTRKEQGTGGDRCEPGAHRVHLGHRHQDRKASARARRTRGLAQASQRGAEQAAVGRHTEWRTLDHFPCGGPTARPAHIVRGSSRRITTMRFRPANIRVINRRDSSLDRCLVCSTLKWDP